jgi:hypothetical protein
MDNLVLSMTAGVGKVSLKGGKDGLQVEGSDATGSRPYAAGRGGPHA